MKFIFGILIAGLVAVALADEELKRPEIIPTTPKAPINVRDKRGFILSTYAAPVAAVPVAIAGTKEATEKLEIASLPAPVIEKTSEETDSVSITTVPVATPVIATPLTYTLYSAAVPYAYPAYKPYVPYYPTFPAFYY